MGHDRHAVWSDGRAGSGRTGGIAGGFIQIQPKTIVRCWHLCIADEGCVIVFEYGRAGYICLSGAGNILTTSESRDFGSTGSSKLRR